MSVELIALLCGLCLVPFLAAGSIIMFALGTIRCGRLMDPYSDENNGGTNGGRCPLGPHGPPSEPSAKGPKGVGSRDPEADWWPQFERELGRYVEEQESCPAGRDAQRRAVVHGAPSDR